MVICQRCGKENQAHYKFCLGCGGELSEQDASRSQSPSVDRKGVPPTGRQTPLNNIHSNNPPQNVNTGTDNLRPHMSQNNVKPDQNVAENKCPQCGTTNPPGFSFCGGCGSRIGEAQAAPSEPADIISKKSEPFARLALIRPDGTEGGSVMLDNNVFEIGRGSGPLFDNDSYLSPKHARISKQEDQIIIEDLTSLNGVFVRITSDEQLFNGDVFRIGQELLRFDSISEPAPQEDGTEILGSPNPGYWGRLSLIVRRDIDGSAFPLMGDEMVLGRERGDILFSDDGYVSGTHAKLSITQQGEIFLSDLGSSNGTFILIHEPRQIPFGTFILIGQQLFRIEAP